MTSTELDSRRPAAVAVGRPRALWPVVVGVYAASRIVTTLIVLVVARIAIPESRIGTHASVVQALGAWDGQWYRFVAAHGYPAHLPTDANGATLTNAWAFLPGYPMLVRALSLGEPGAWLPTAEVVSAAFGLGAAVLLALLVRPHAGDRGALAAVAFFSFSPVGFVLQSAYAESMGLCCMFAVLCLVDRHRYIAAVLPVVALAFIRPGLQAVALTVAAHLVLRMVARRRGVALPGRELAAGLALTGVATAAGFAWDRIAAVATGVPDAYIRSETAWRELWTGAVPFSPFASWAWAGDFWLGSAGPVVLGVLAALAVLLLLIPPVRRLGTLNRLWAASYLLYVAAVFFPQTSLPRILMPIAPIGGALGSIRGRVLLAVLLVVSVVLQALWFWRCYGGDTHFWTVP